VNRLFPISGSVAVLLLTGCMVGPQYKRPAAITAPSFKEAPVNQTAQNDGWKPGQPSDQKLKGDWWLMYQDRQLTALEEQVNTANQTLKAAEANFRAARAAIGFARASEAPTIGVAPSTSTVRESANEPYFFSSLANNGTGDFVMPFDMNYEVDLWGRIRRGVTAAREQAQASAADIESVRLSLHAELATDYFGLRSADSQKKLLDDTIKAYQDALKLTQDRFNGGLALSSDVTQAESQLDQAMVQRSDIEVQRAQFEHAIAVLIGKPPSELSIPNSPLDTNFIPPVIPPGLPSELLQRRPDIATAERRANEGNEAIGIAQTAFYPSVLLSAALGFSSTTAISSVFSPASAVYSLGPGLAYTFFDGGRRRGIK